MLESIYYSVQAFGVLALTLVAGFAIYLGYLKFIFYPDQVAFYTKQGALTAKGCTNLMGNIKIAQAHK